MLKMLKQALNPLVQFENDIVTVHLYNKHLLVTTLDHECVILEVTSITTHPFDDEGNLHVRGK